MGTVSSRTDSTISCAPLPYGIHLVSRRFKLSPSTAYGCHYLDNYRAGGGPYPPFDTICVIIPMRASVLQDTKIK